MKRHSPASIVLFLLFCLPSVATAQTASISGIVTDLTGAVIPRATVTARNLATNTSRDTITDGSGIYRITNLAPGEYTVLIGKEGFKTAEYARVELTVGQVQNLNPVLAPSAVGETVTVHGEEIALVSAITTSSLTALTIMMLKFLV